MQLPNRIILASAGSGKTTAIIDEACADKDRFSALITYTINGCGELSRAAYEQHGYIPSSVTISTWFSFLLHHFVRPYQNCLYAPRITRINFNQGQSARYIPATNIAKHYFSSPGTIYRDKISKFACEVIKRTDGLPLKRFEAIFDRLYIDESQDIAAYDLELVEFLLKSNVEVVLVGDHRQAIYVTNDGRKNKKYAKENIVRKFIEWESESLCKIEYQTHSHRCTQPICDFADRLYPGFPQTISLNKYTTGHDGVFAVTESQLNDYFARFAPQPMRYNRKFETIGKPINFGISKGMTFMRTLIFPHGPLLKYIQTGKLEDAGREVPKLYVAITRARQSVAFVVPDGMGVSGMQMYKAL